jgi:hypothetical protein
MPLSTDMHLKLVAIAKDSLRLSWLIEHAGWIEVEVNGVPRAIHNRREIDDLMCEEKPRAE